MAKPEFEVFVVQDAKQEGAKASWTKVAAMFAHKVDIHPALKDGDS